MTIDRKNKSQNLKKLKKKQNKMMNDDGKNHRTHKKVTLLFLSFYEIEE